jgi:hypothetical protein
LENELLLYLWACAPCNTWTNVTITQRNTSTFFGRKNGIFLKKIVKEDGLEEMDQWLGLLDRPTSIH